MITPTPEQRPYAGWAVQRWAVIAAWIAGIFGSIWGVYSHFQNQSSRELLFYANSVNGEIVKAGQATALSVSFGGKPVTTDISVAQVVIWNAGRLSIKSENVFKAATVIFPKDVEILEASLRKVTRDVSEISLNLEKRTEGRMRVDWKILEQDDGALIQIVYTGRSGITPRLECIIEAPVSENSRGDDSKARVNVLGFVASTGLALAAFLGMNILVYHMKMRRLNKTALYTFIGVFLVLVIGPLVVRRIYQPLDAQSPPRALWPSVPRGVSTQ